MSDARAPEYKEADRQTVRDGNSTPRPIVPALRARQAVTGHNVRYVLGLSMVAIAILFVVIYLFYFG